jgi:dTDP-4-amino-4,6-dideoxygalactose transaminase
VLVDVDPETCHIDADAVRSAITPRTKALVPVHLYGMPADMDGINALAAQYGLAVLEDACQAHGAKYKGKRAGSLAHAAAFSFYPGKNLGAYGDGGAIVTSDDALADQLRAMRNYGQRGKNVHCTKGFNRRLDTLQAAVLRVKLRHLDQWNAMRDQHARSYRELLLNSGLALPCKRADVDSAWHLYVVRSSRRDALRAYLDGNGIGTGMHYPTPIHLQAAYCDAGYRKGAFPVTERLSQEVLSLPMYAELEPHLLQRTADAIMSNSDVKRPSVLLSAQMYSAPGVRTWNTAVSL